jgi:hypothetical protein
MPQKENMENNMLVIIKVVSNTDRVALSRPAKLAMVLFIFQPSNNAPTRNPVPVIAIPFLNENPDAKRLPVDNPELLTPNMNDVYSAMGRSTKLKIPLYSFTNILWQ